MESLNWYNSSQGSNIKSPSKNSITFKTNPKTDIWRTPREHRKNAHFFYQDVSGDFLVSVKFKGDYKSQYDQAGIMLRVGDDKWLKSGIELINGVPHVSAVVTNPYSDWSIIPLQNFTKDSYLYLRVERKGPKILIDYFIPPKDFKEPEDVNKLDWILLRKITSFSDASLTQVGISAATPQGDDGFDVSFEGYKLD